MRARVSRCGAAPGGRGCWSTRPCIRLPDRPLRGQLFGGAPALTCRAPLSPRGTHRSAPGQAWAAVRNAASASICSAGMCSRRSAKRWVTLAVDRRWARGDRWHASRREQACRRPAQATGQRDLEQRTRPRPLLDAYHPSPGISGRLNAPIAAAWPLACDCCRGAEPAEVGVVRAR